MSDFTTFLDNLKTEIENLLSFSNFFSDFWELVPEFIKLCFYGLLIGLVVYATIKTLLSLL